jgi:hypothetical protein
VLENAVSVSTARECHMTTLIVLFNLKPGADVAAY